MGKNREYMSKDEVATLTAMLESFFIISALEAKNRMDVAVMNLPGAFLHATNKDNMITTMIGKLVELMVIVVRIPKLPNPNRQ